MKGITKKLFLILFLCTLGVVSLLGLFEFHAGQLAIESQVNRTLLTIGKRLSLTLRQSVYELDRVTIHDTLLGEFPYEEVRVIVVWDQYRSHIIAGLERYADGSIVELQEAPSERHLVRGSWPVTIPSRRSPEGLLQVGEIDVFIDRTPLTKGLIKDLTFNLTKVLLTVILLLMLVSRIIRRYLVVPLEHLQQEMQNTKKLYAAHSESSIFDDSKALLSEDRPERAFSELQQMDDTFREMVMAFQSSQGALQESEYRYRQLSLEFKTVLDGIVDSLVLIDRELKVVWGNQGAALQFDLPADELVGKTCHQLWIGAEEDVCDVCVRAVFNTREANESIRKAADGSVWGVKVYPVLDGQGQVANVIQIASDLSEKLQLREEAARAAHLAALGGLSAGIAHEINNPTGLVLMSLPFIRDSIEDLLPLIDDCIDDHPDLMIAKLPYDTFRGEILQTIDDMQNGALRVKRIVKDLKDFAREEPAGEETELEFPNLVNKSLRMLHNVIKNSTDNFILEMEEDLPSVKGSTQRMEQVLVNLVQNACQALTKREQAVTLGVHTNQTANKVLLRVTDEGCGMEKELLGKITNPFFTTRRDAGGTGLGLSVSTRIIEEHGGTLKISSETGRGSVFTVELPVTMEQHHDNKKVS